MSEHLQPQDEAHLARAIELAQAAAAFASPNPTVGCVIATVEGVAIGEGAHFYDRRDHAEIAALKAAAANGHAVRGGSVYVTLEPCTVTGRTGPCADALIAAGIARCVVATADPNPAVHGQGIHRMRAAGIDVLLLDAQHPLAQASRRLNDAFAYSVTHDGRPFVTLKSALSVDGKIAPPPQTRSEHGPFWLTGEAARHDVQRLRHRQDTILTGIGTVLADDPSLTDRTGLPRRRPLLRVVLDSALQIPLASKLVTSAQGDLLVMCAPGAPVAAEEALKARGVDVFRGNFAEAYDHLASRSIRSLLVEAGPAVNSSFLHLNLVQKLVLYFAEAELGADAVPFSASVLPQTLLEQMTSQERVSFVHGNGEDVRISGYLDDPWRRV